MTTNTQTITYLSLFRKYHGKIMRADSREMKAAARAIPADQGNMQALFSAALSYEKELEKKYRSKGLVPAVCVNRDGLCEDDHCRCWK